MRQRYTRSASARVFVARNRSGISFDRSNGIRRRARGHITATRTWIHASTGWAITRSIVGLASARSRLSLRSTR
jgi:hypothetical protein